MNCLSVFDHFVGLVLKGLKNHMSFKVFVLGDISGFSCKFEFLTGATDHVCVTNEPDFGASSNIVIRPAGHIPEKGNYKIYVNN